MTKKNKKLKMKDFNQRCFVDKNYQGLLDRHHINGRDIPNWDADWNVVYVSPNTHRLIHEGKIIIEGWFTTTSGRELIWHYNNEESISGRDSIPHIIH